MAVTLRDVARQAHVSASTVSRALRDHPHVSDATRETVVQAAQAPDLDAIVYASDGIAIGGLRALKESGRRVPDDVAITGFYDYEFSRFTDPPLTTVRVDLHAMNAIAARRLCMMLEEPDDQAWCVTDSAHRSGGAQVHLIGWMPGATRARYWYTLMDFAVCDSPKRRVPKWHTR